MKATKSASVKEAPQDEKNGPVKVFRNGDVSAAIFAREYNGKTFHSWVLTRSYRDTSGQRKYTHSLNHEDCEAVADLTKQVAQHVCDLETGK